MRRKLAILIAGALFGSLITVAPASAQVAVPGEVQIDDPKGDANGLNDQDNAYGTPLAGQGDHVSGQGGTSTDLLKVWFSNTSSDISLHFQTNGNPGNLVYDSYFRFSSNPGTGSVANDEARGCLQWVASVNGLGGGWSGETSGALTDKCNVGTAVEGPLVIEEGPDGTFVSTMTFPRSYSPLLSDGKSITTPFGVSRVLYVGPSPTTAAFVTMDNTKRGSDYAISSGGTPPVEEPPVVEPPGKNDPPGQGNQNCAKIKDKKEKKACKKNSGKGPKVPPAGACAAFTPGEMGAEAETTLVTDKATEEEPVVVEFDLGPALGRVNSSVDFSTRIKHNVQLDVPNAEGGFFMKLSTPETDDPDLYAFWDNGTQAASAGGLNQALFAGPVPGPAGAVTNGTGSGGHSGFGYEQIDGLRTADCGGWTLDLVNWGGQGGTYTLSLWAGEVLNDPAPRE